ncbi:Radial spoke head 14 [Dinochytrium kinnereticum]|nr:Radial spoke head 14 [Dinochytrium kinnereticum]
MATAVAPASARIINMNQSGLSPKELSELLVPQLPPGVDPTKMQLAYGRGAVPKLVSEVEDSTLIVRQKSLVFLANLFHNPENVSQGLQEGIVMKLTQMLIEKDLTIKQKATECLSIIAGHAVGRASLVENNTLVSLSKLFDDENDLVRKNLHEVFLKLTTQQSGVQNLLIYNLLTPLVKKLPSERMDIQVMILDTLYQCIRLGTTPWMPKEAIESDAMSVFTHLLKTEPVPETKVAAARCVMMLSFHPEGKQIAVKGETVNVLIRMMTDKKASVRAAAAGALMSITIDCEAKRIMVRENAVTILMELLDDTNESVLLNVVKTITNVAEDYRGRFQLHGSLKKGCYQDSGNPRALRVLGYSGDQTSPNKCHDECTKLGFPFFGMEYGTECFCDNLVPPQSAPMTECNIPCKGEPNAMCGGPFRLSVYSVSPRINVSFGYNTTRFQYQGCYNDTAKVMTKRSETNLTDVFECHANCKKLGFYYSAPEFGQAQRVPDPECYMHCSNNLTEICGGPGLKSVYSIIGSQPFPASSLSQIPNPRAWFFACIFVLFTIMVFEKRLI